MNPRQILIALAAVFVIAGLVLGFRSIQAGDNPFDQVDCGSVFHPDRSAGQISDDISGGDDQSDCASAVSDAKPLAYGALGIGAIALIAGLVVPSRRPVAQP